MTFIHVDAVVTSPGVINTATIILEQESRFMTGSASHQTANADPDVIGDLDIIFHINAFFGTDWTLTLTLPSTTKTFTGTTGASNKSSLVTAIPI